MFKTNSSTGRIFWKASETKLTLENIVLEIQVNRLNCGVTIDEVDFNSDPLNPEIKQLIEVHTGAMTSALPDKQYIKAFLQAILQKLVRKHMNCAQRI